MEFSTYDHGNTNGRCIAKSKVPNWQNGGGIDRVCSSQSVNGIYVGKFKPSLYEGAMYWRYDTPLKTIQLMVKPVA